MKNNIQKPIKFKPKKITKKALNSYKSNNRKELNNTLDSNIEHVLCKERKTRISLKKNVVNIKEDELSELINKM
jgi:hypothetical protein